jgi:hypothetical protein
LEKSHHDFFLKKYFRSSSDTTGKVGRSLFFEKNSVQTDVLKTFTFCHQILLEKKNRLKKVRQ